MGEASEQDQKRGRLPRRLDHPGLGRRLGAAFPGVKVANRGISGDTTRGVLIRLQEDVLALNPTAVVLLIGTNDLEEGAAPDVIAGNLKLILAALEATRRTHADRALPGLPELGDEEAAGRPDQDDQRALPGRGQERPAGHARRNLAAVRGRERRRPTRGVPRPAPSQRSRLREMGGRPPPDLRHPGPLRDVEDPFTPRGRIREPVQRPRPDRLGLSAHLRGGPGERGALAGVGPERGRLAVRRRTRRLRRPDGHARRPLRREGRPPRGDDAARSIGRSSSCGRSASSPRTSSSSSSSAPRRTPTAASSSAARSCSAGTTGSPDRTRRSRTTGRRTGTRSS